MLLYDQPPVPQETMTGAPMYPATQNTMYPPQPDYGGLLSTAPVTAIGDPRSAFGLGVRGVASMFPGVGIGAIVNGLENARRESRALENMGLGPLGPGAIARAFGTGYAYGPQAQIGGAYGGYGLGPSGTDYEGAGYGGFMGFDDGISTADYEGGGYDGFDGFDGYDGSSDQDDGTW